MFDKEMQAALIADGKKLAAMTGEDHGPYFDDYDDDYDDDYCYDEPPLYPSGKLASMTLDELHVEASRQCEIQGALGDAEYIDESAVARAENRYRLVEYEIRSRENT